MSNCTGPGAWLGIEHEISSAVTNEAWMRETVPTRHDTSSESKRNEP